MNDTLNTSNYSAIPGTTINPANMQINMPEEPIYNNSAQSVQSTDTQQQTVQQPQTLEDKLAQFQQKWTNEITELNNMMKSLPKLDELLNIIYTKRQEAVEYYHSMNSVILKQTKEYKTEFNMICNNIRLNGVNGIRIANDTAIAKHAESVLIDKKTAIEQLGNHNNYIKETIQTIDNMIYGINQKVKLAEIMNGLKF